jgi:electron transfer flavoprotein alpha subunit
MNIIVCVKQIPDVAEMKFDHEQKTLVREGVRNILNPFDKRSITQAVRIREQLGGEVTVMTMGPPQAKEALYECLAIGGDKAVHLVDRAFAGADTLATARALAAAIKRRPFDLIFCGKYSVDAETGQVGPEVAELLGIPHITGVTGLRFDSEAGRFVAERETDEGFETIECQLPALITAAERLVKPIKVKEPDIAAVRHKPIETVTAADLSQDGSIFGQAGSPTWVSEIISLERSRPLEMITGSAAQMAEVLVEKLCARGLFSGWEASGTRPKVALDQPVEKAEGKTIWAVAELASGELRGVSYELLGKGRELAQRLRGELAAVLIGKDVAGYAEGLAAHGADRVYLIEDDRLAEFNPLHYASALTEAIQRLQPYAVLIPSTANGRDYAPRVAARLGLGLTADCVDLDLNERGELVQYKPAFGGRVVAPIFSRTWPQMATVRPGMLERAVPDWSRSCVVEHLEVNEIADHRYRVLASSRAIGRASTELDDAEVVVCVGTGIGGPESLPLIEAFARVLGAAIGATRRVVDQGWLPRQQQVGLTGRAVAPQLYFGVGVRGAFNHTIGIERSGIIVAINNDPQAEIFQAADYGLVADFAEAIPALATALERKKRQLAAASGG